MFLRCSGNTRLRSSGGAVAPRARGGAFPASWGSMWFEWPHAHNGRLVNFIVSNEGSTPKCCDQSEWAIVIFLALDL